MAAFEAPITASEMGLPESRQPEVTEMQEHLRPYTHREKQLLRLKYTPKQMEAIEAGEKAISTRDLMLQGRFRTDPMRIDYIDDFATKRPLVDLPTSEQEGTQEESRAMDEGRGARDNRMRNRNNKTEEEDPHMLRLMQQTGLEKDEIRKIRVKNLVSHRVVNQTRMGKIQSLYYLTIAGNGDGMLGIGEGKSAEHEDGSRQAMMSAIRNMKPIPRYEARTIYGNVEGKVGASVVQLSARPPGESSRVFMCSQASTH